MSTNGDDEHAPESDDAADDEHAPESDDVAELITEAEPSAAADPEESVDAPAEDDEEEGAVAGSIAPDLAVTPQTPTPENTLFVSLGIYITVLVLADAVVGLYPLFVVVAFVAVGLTTAACYGVLVRTIPDT